MDLSAIDAPFSYAGGTFPGMGGTCTSVLAPGRQCTIVVRFSSSGPEAQVIGNATFRYTGPGSSRTLILPLRGRTDNGTFSMGTGPNGPIRAIANVSGGTGDIYVGGNFTSYNGSSDINRLVKLKYDGSVDTSFDLGVGATAGFNDEVYSLAVAADGDLYVGGIFTSFNGTSNINGIIRLNPNGTVDSGFNIGVGASAGFFAVINPSVRTIVPALDGTTDIYVSGNFTAYNGTGINRIVRLNENGTIDPAFNVGSGFDGWVFAMVASTDGSEDIYAAGSFASYSSTGVNGIVRLNPNGTIDGGFTPSGGGGVISTLGVAGDGSGDLYVGGDFITFNAVANRNRLVRLNSDGTLDSGFDIGTGPSAGFDAIVRTLLGAVDGTGDVYAGGNFTTYNGLPSNYLVRLNDNGSIDSSFSVTTGASNVVWKLIFPNDGSSDILVGTLISNEISRLSLFGVQD